MVYNEFPDKDFNQFQDYFKELITNTLKKMVYNVPNIGPEVFVFAANETTDYDMIKLEFDTFPDDLAEREKLMINMGKQSYELAPGAIVGVYLIIGGFTRNPEKPDNPTEVLSIIGLSVEGKTNYAVANVTRVDNNITKLTDWRTYPYPSQKAVKTDLLEKFWAGYRLEISKRDAKSIYGIMRGFQSDN